MRHANVVIPDKPHTRTAGDWLTLTLAFLGAIKLILAAPPFEIHIVQESWDAWANLISLIFAGIGIWKNTYVTETAQKQKEVLQQTGLKK
jgi:hypothetical protein